MTAIAVGRIQDKTRWTKALGEAVTVVYGDCTGDIGQSRHNDTVGQENTGPLLTQRLAVTGQRNSIGCRPTRREAWKNGELMRGLWHRGAQLHGFLVADQSSGGIP